MKKIILLFVLLTLSRTVLATSEFTPFTTLDQAKLYCPAPNELTFIPNIPTSAQSAGKITGNNRTVFESIPPKTAPHPKTIDLNNHIQGVQFRSAEGLYGYISNNVVTCLYTYTVIKLNTPYALIIRGI